MYEAIGKFVVGVIIVNIATKIYIEVVKAHNNNK